MSWSYRFGVRPGLDLLVAVLVLCVPFMALEPRAEAGVGDGEGVAFASGVDIAAAVGQKNEIRIVYPAKSAHISGKIHIKLKVGQKIKKVFVFIDDRYLASGPPYTIFWNSATVSNGPHRITVAAATPALSPDALFLASQSQTTKFFVHNKPTPTPTSTPTPTADPTPTTPPGALNLLSGSYSGCTNGVGSGCAKGDYRSGSDATVSTSSSTLTTPTGAFTSADVGKHGVTVDWAGGVPISHNSTTCTAQAGWGCWNGVSCEFTVASVNSSSSINVTRGSGCGSSGIGFTASATAYWALYTDDSTALSNAAIAAHNAAVPLYVPTNYQGGIGGSPSFYNGFTLECASGATFYNPHLSPNNAYSGIMIILGGSGYTITNCTFSGTEPTNAAWMDVDREYDLGIAIEGGASNVSFTNNVVQNFWGTYSVGTSKATNVVITGNTFKNCEYYGVQLGETGGTSSVTNNTFIDCDYGSEDGGAEYSVR